MITIDCEGAYFAQSAFNNNKHFDGAYFTSDYVKSNDNDQQEKSKTVVQPTTKHQTDKEMLSIMKDRIQKLENELESEQSNNEDLNAKFEKLQADHTELHMQHEASKEELAREQSQIQNLQNEKPMFYHIFNFCNIKFKDLRFNSYSK